jgi:3D (Asp-Asp-Asp) domain-containing protein
MLVLSTAYSYTGNLTRTESEPEDNYTVAVDPAVIPLGSIVLIDGAAHEAADAGSLIKGLRIDRYYLDPIQAKDYGAQWIWITVYPPIG